MMQHGEMAKGSMTTIISDPEMRGEMKAMMKSCNQMMARIDAVRRQNIWRISRRKLAECGPRLGVDVRRQA